MGCTNYLGIALAVAVAQAHAAEPSKHQWKTIPGHKNILVDLASVEPIRRSLSGPDQIPTENSIVAIRLNGHIYKGYMFTCSGFGPRGVPSKVLFPQVGFEKPKVMGIVPADVVEDLACPEARKRTPPP